MKHESRIMIIILAFIALFMIQNSLFIIHTVYAADPPCSNTTTDKIYQQFGPCPAGLNDIENTVANVISVVVGLGFIAALVLLIMTGIKYLISGGEPKAIQAAHLTLTFALLGVALLAISWLILQLIANFTGVDVTVFDIKSLCKLGTDPLKFCTPWP